MVSVHEPPLRFTSDLEYTDVLVPREEYEALKARPTWADVPVWRACYQAMEYGREYTLAEVVTALRGLGVMLGHSQSNAGSAARGAMLRRGDLFRWRAKGWGYAYSLRADAGRRVLG